MSKLTKFLIVDDAESNLLFWEMVLRQLGRADHVNTATTGAQADALAKAENPHLVICGWELSPTPGTVVIQRIRNRRPHLPCLIFTKTMSEADVQLTRELGFPDILGMPFNRETATAHLLGMIEREEQLSSEEKKIRKIEALLDEGKYTEALKWFDPVLTRKKNDVKLRSQVALAKVWFETQNTTKAEQVLAALTQEWPDDHRVLQMQARLYSQRGEHPKAIAILEKMVARSPHNLGSLVRLGSAYVDADRHEEARKIFNRVEDLDNENQELVVQQGKLAFKEGDMGLAAKFLAQTEHGDTLASHFNNIAIAKAASQSFDEAIKTYQNALEVLADRAKTHLLLYNLGLAWKKKGDLAQAFAQLCASYLEEPQFEKGYAALARVARQMRAVDQTPDPELVARVKQIRHQHRSEARPSG